MFLTVYYNSLSRGITLRAGVVHFGGKRNYLPTRVIASRRRRRSNLKFHRSNKNIRETREGDCFGGYCRLARTAGR